MAERSGFHKSCRSVFHRAARAVALALAALNAATACGGESSNDNTCPTAVPSGSCSADPDLWCEYGGSCGPAYACQHGQWMKVRLPCDPPGPPTECPPKSTPLPSEGDSCPPWGPAHCIFTTSCGLFGSATCHAGAYEDIFDPCVDGGTGSAPDSSDAADSATDRTNMESGTDGE